ncbi:O-acetyl-ADP-ribose deacetylase [Ekhidna sp.]|jgi:O-acetyl-ADP-ribose deacetylase (regulator of RNase III)|uniref:O-acetyl-ADP-ribose deacetylase n=1 Tax=Ekhidna sp. TaxID=2608089 RepID=UPI0032ECCAF7
MEIKLLQGDITKLNVDAIVNAANSRLLGGGGVDGAIHRAGGPAILEECKVIGGCETGQAVITTAGNLQAKFVIHTVGPIWQGGDSHEETLLRSCYIKSLKLAEEYNLKTIAFPNISTGVYRFPKERAGEIAMESVRSFPASVIHEVTFVCFDEENFHLYKNLIETS